jgi:hypothetical protein
MIVKMKTVPGVLIENLAKMIDSTIRQQIPLANKTFNVWVMERFLLNLKIKVDSQLSIL